MEGLQLVEIDKSYGKTVALDGVSFQVAEEEIVAVLGPSGCGKSTLLRVIAGLEPPDRGRVIWKGRHLAGVPPHRRGFGLMFQEFALFPHMDVHDNVAFGLRMEDLPPDRVHARVEEVLSLVGLADFADRDVSTLSGGERQRVALARSLAPQPRLLMLDEPLGSLDRTLRERLMIELRRILKRMDQTALYITHDQEEAFAVADRVVLLRAGRVAQIGPPQEIYHRPASPFAARFLGLTNLFSGKVRAGEAGATVETPIGSFPLSGEAQPGPATVLLRPDAVHLEVRDSEGYCRLQGTLAERSFRGALYRAVISVDGHRLTFDFPPGAPLPPERESVSLWFRPEEALTLFPESESNSGTFQGARTF